jgi:hypothetical protein
MPLTIPDEVPKLFASGTTVKFHRSFDDYLASAGWTYIFHANGPTTRLDVPATINPDGQSFDIVIPANVSALTTPSFASLPPGRYTCAERVTNSTTGEVDDPRDDDIQVTVEADVSVASAGAFISQIENELNAINAVIAQRLAADVQSYQITSGAGGGRAIVKTPLEQLYQIRGRLKASLFQLKHPGQLGSTVHIAFTNEPEDPTYPPTWVDVTGLDR